MLQKLTLVFLLLPCLGPVTAADSPKPNIVLIMAEDIGTDLACYGTTGVRTPLVP